MCGGSAGRRIPSVVPEFEIVECRQCASARTWPPVPPSAIGGWYPQAYYGVGNVRFNRLFEALVRWFRRRRADTVRRFTRPGAVLDVGCGRGRTLASLRNHGYRCIGVELSDVAAGHARDELGLDVRVGDFLQLDLPASSFEAIIFWQSLEHFADPIAAIERASALLKPGGLLVIAVPNWSSLQAQLSGRHWFHLDIPRHYVHFSRRGLREALQKRGFRIANEAHFSLEQNPYGWIQSVLNLAFEHDLLYSILKDREARAHRLSEFPVQTAASAILGALLLPFSLGLMMVETVARRGGTIEVYAIKEAA